MKIIGAEEALATGTTKGKTATAHYVFNNGSKQAVTIRNADDDGDADDNDNDRGAMKMKMMLMFRDSTRPGESGMPDEIYGASTLLD